MATAEEVRMLRNESRKIEKATGVAVDLISNRQPWSSWWKPDGTPLPNQLPADAYHATKYMKRGWTMVPPMAGDLNPVGFTPEAVSLDAETVIAHPHQFPQKMGSGCRVNDCDAIRTTPFKKRAKKSVPA
jgi:hypothetical protein